MLHGVINMGSLPAVFTMQLPVSEKKPVRYRNQLDNAVKYTPEYGSIRVCVESWEMHLKVSITDTGKGIPENQQGAIFRRFYREEDVHDIEGIGIGLYLAREIISLQKGYIQVTSQVGTGSTFSVFLPHE